MMVRRLRAAAAVLAAATLTLTACTGSPAGPHTAAVAPNAGRYPVAVAGAQVTHVTQVSEGGYALVAAGDPVRVHLGRADLVITVTGPDVDVPQPVPGEPISARSAPGVLTVTATAQRGSTSVTEEQFLGLNEDQKRFPLSTDRGGGTVAPGHPISFDLRSRFASGHTTLTWQPRGHPLVTWDFTIEID